MGKYIATYKAFWWQCTILSVKSSFNIFTGVATIIGIVSIIVAQFYADWSRVLMILAWAIPIGVFVAVFLANLIHWPYSLYEEKAIMVSEYESRNIELVVENTDKFVGLRRGDNKICRVGVKTSGIKTVTNVKVTLLAWDNNNNAFSDEPLNPTEAQRLGVNPYFSVNPKETKFVEVLSCNTKNKKLGIIYYKNYQHYLQEIAEAQQKSVFALSLGLPNPFQIPSSIPYGEHTITLYATGSDTLPDCRDFTIDIKGDEVYFYEVNDGE